MSTIFKALTRPALIRGLGVPVIPFVVMCVGVMLLATWTYDFCYFLILPLWFLMKRVTENDPRFFDILYLRIQLNGRQKSNSRFSSLHYSANTYDDVDISKVDKFMKLTDQESFEDLIPYSSHIKKDIVITKKQEFIATWKIEGVFFECSEDESLRLLTDQLNTLLRGFDGYPITFYTHRNRQRKKVSANFKSNSVHVDKVMTAYNKSQTKKVYYENNIFLSVVYSPFSMEDKINNALSKKNGARSKSFYDEVLNTMDDLSGRLDNYLSRFHAVRLGLFEENKRTYSSQLSLFQFLLTGKWQKVKVSKSPIYTYLGGKDIFFGNDAAQISAGQDNRYFRSIEIRDYFQNSDTGIFDALMYLPVEYVFTSSFEAMKRPAVIKSLDDQLEKLVMSQDAAASQIADLKVALDMATSGFISFGKCHQSLVVYSDSPEQLAKDTNIVVNTLQDLGLIVSYSTLSLGASFFAQLPGNKRFRPRVSVLSSLNFAEMEPFHNFYSGKADGNSWGESLLTVEGSGQDVYHLNYHMTNNYQDFFGKNPTLGHTDVIGSSNVGKTVNLMIQAFSAQKFGHVDSFPPNKKVKKMTTVFFDKDRAAEVGIRYMGGEYYKVEYGKPTGWNPFALEPNKRNVKFIKDLMYMVCNYDEKSHAERKSISDAVELLMLREDRTYGISKLSSIIVEPNDKDTQRNGIKSRLKSWKQGGEYGWVFDNAFDTFDINEKNIFGIDGTEFLSDKITALVVPFYLIYRVTMLADGRRLLVYMDEFWQWLKNPSMSDFVYNVLKTGRKLDIVLVFATQSPDELIKVPIAAALREQCATHIYMANPRAKEHEYVDGLGVPKQYFEKIESIDPLSRKFLVVKNPHRKQDSEDFAAFAKVELGDASYYLPVLSASKEQLEIFDSIYVEGMKPDEWSGKYLKLANSL